MATTTSDVISSIPQYYHKLFTERLERDPILYNLLPKKDVPANSGKTIYFPRMSSSSTRPSAYVSSEGTAVTTEAVGDVRVSATLETYRNAKSIWDIAKLTALSTYMAEVVEEQGSQAANVIDRKILETAYATAVPPVIAGTISDNWGGGGAGFSTIYLSGLAYTSMRALHSTAVITAAAIRSWVKRLRARDVRPYYDDGMYLLVVHSDTEMQIQADSVWRDTYQYTDAENMKKGLFGRYGGVKMARDNNIFLSAAGSAGATVYFSLLLGKGAMAVSNLNGGVKTYTKESDSGDTSNPVNEFVTFGWKVHFVPKVLNASAGLICATTDA